jgi:phosphatidate cytidylyltransferase
MSETLTRFISGVVYVSVLIFATTYSVQSFYLLFGFFLLIAVYEFCKMQKINWIAPILISTICYYLSIQFSLNRTFDNSILAITILTSFILLRLLFNTSINIIGTGLKYFFLLGYVLLPFIIITKIPFNGLEFKPKILISIFILIWTNDTFAYLVGKSIGKRKLFEKISPKKTIEGFLGGLIFTVISAVLISKFYFQPSPKHAEMSLFIWVISALIISVFSTLGDLIESKFKRMAAIKDSGKIMPGHGGILDRLDSIIFVSPFVFLFYQILYYVS